MGCGASTQTSVIEIPSARVQLKNFSSLDQVQQQQQAAAHRRPSGSRRTAGHSSIVPSAPGASSGNRGRHQTRLSTREALQRYMRMQKVQQAAICYRLEKCDAAEDARAEGEAACASCPLHKISKEPGNATEKNPLFCVRSCRRCETV
eukprot:TRINITY_DN8424_c1_g1_i1.p1 TRINITY_DN8424_c1_g1~~TRINITY_DN8424_c1_g1_i1.p1  ORF type:complete len:148 (+),score=27.74 TRINITY_DN8424_c1_g1_i1:215-658(+)